MIEWSETHQAFRDMVRRFVDAEVKPRIAAIEHDGEPPYELLRKLLATFGIGEMAKAQFFAELEREKARIAAGEPPRERTRKPSAEAGDRAAMQSILISEMCRHSPGMITAFGVSIGLTAGAITSRGTVAQKERFVPELLTLEKVGAWAITEP